MSQSVLITGGAGFLGINLARSLLRHGWTVSVLDIAPFSFPEREHIGCFRGDVRQCSDVRAAMHGVDAVVHAAAALPLYSAKDVYSTDVLGTEVCLRTAREQSVPRFVHISSTSVYGIPKHHPVHETDELVGVGPYGKAKVQAEALCQSYREKGMTVPIIRPKSFIGPERLGIFGFLYEWAADGCDFPLPGGGRWLHQLLDVEDLCEAIRLALSAAPGAANATCNVGASDFGTLADDFQSVLDYAGFGRRVVPLPRQPFLGFLDIAYRAGISPIYPWVYKLLFQDSVVSIDKAAKLWGFKPARSNRDALLGNFEWYLRERLTVGRSRGVSHRQMWKEGPFAVAKAFFR